MWLSQLGIVLQSKRSLVQFPVRTQAWVADQVPSRGHARGNHTLMVLSLSSSLPLSLPLSLKINKIFKKKKQIGHFKRPFSPCDPSFLRSGYSQIAQCPIHYGALDLTYQETFQERQRGKQSSPAIELIPAQPSSSVKRIHITATAKTAKKMCS